MGDPALNASYDVIAFGAHPDDLEAVMGGTTVKLVRKGLSVLFVDLCEGEPARHAAHGERHKQAVRAAEILGVEPLTRDYKLRAHCGNIDHAWCSRPQVQASIQITRP
jgi:LmbE family N-acetylglucosaminyl deacetylase